MVVEHIQEAEFASKVRLGTSVAVVLPPSKCNATLIAVHHGVNGKIGQAVVRAVDLV